VKIGVLGSGHVGQALALGFTREGHDVKIGTRKPDTTKVTFAEAARFGELAVLATRWGDDGRDTQNAIKLAEAKNLAGKIVIDVTNPIKAVPNAPPGLALGFDDSGGEQVQRWLPGARVVKAFNTVGSGLMYKPQLPGGPPDMFICGDDAAAKQAVAGICQAFGWRVTDVGGIAGARLLEALALLWVVIALRAGRWDGAWKLLRAS